MSWSVTLSGPPNVVARELSDLLIVADKALDYAVNSDEDTVSVNLSGFVSWNEQEEITNSGVSFSLSESSIPSS